MLAKTAKVVKAQSTLQHPSTMTLQTMPLKKINTVVAIHTASQAAVHFTADPNMMTQQIAHLKKISMAQTTEDMVHLMIITILVDRLDVAVLVLSKILK